MCGIGTILAVRAHRLPSWNMRSVRATASPKIGRGQPKSHYHPGDFEGIDAPWALSALPECLIPQTTFRAKTVENVLRYLPHGAQPVRAGTTLTYRNCDILVRAHDALVTRGKDHFHIPPRSRFFTTASRLVFVRMSRWAELRTYSLSNL
ncbi:MAG: hypothetical protein ABR584_05115 [Candidatus Baltobacteraceae bacterium]